MNTLPGNPTPAAILENVIVGGDLSKLTPTGRVEYYKRVCESLGLNPFTSPFAYITLQGRMQLYAKRDAADQLRRLRGVSIEILHQGLTEDLYSVHVQATDSTGRKDEDLGIVPLPASLKGELRANMMLKAVTKAKRRVTLSICGLGFLDENEAEDIPGAKIEPAPGHEQLTLAQEMKDEMPDWDRKDPETVDAADRGESGAASTAAAPEKNAPNQPASQAAAAPVSQNMAMAIEAASHGREQLMTYHKGRSKKDKTEIENNLAYLKSFYPKD